MAPRSDYCLASSQTIASRIVRELDAAEFSPGEVSLLFMADGPGHDACGAAPTAGPRDAMQVARASEPRQAKGIDAGIRPLVQDASNRLLAAGPIAGALDGSTTAQMTTDLANFGMPAAEAGRYVKLIHDRHVLVAVHTANADRGRQARDIFQAAGAADIFTLVTVTTPRDPPRVQLA